MRKSLALIMVLAMATNAHAALSLSLSATTVNVDGVLTVSVSSTDSSPWTYLFVLSEDMYNWTDPVAAAYDGGRTEAVTIMAAAGDQACAIPDATYAAVIQLSAGGSSVPPVAGVQFTVSIEGMQAGRIYVDLQNGNAESQVGGPFFLGPIIPEPMTITLLALGGLMICRRGKK
jgi:hypothetical protein